MALLVGLLGAFAGFLLAILLTYLLYLSGAKDALALVTALFLLWFILIPGGLAVAVLLLRRSRKSRAHLAPP
jgi:hypothetical protein